MDVFMTSMNETMYLIRGVAGSGKSTLAGLLCAADDVPSFHAETDQYFMVSGKYEFNPERLQDAHADCIRRVEQAMLSGRFGRVVVSNTFTRLWELEPYMILATRLRWRYSVIHMETRHQNDHGVPEEAVERMLARWEPLDVNR